MNICLSCKEKENCLMVGIKERCIPKERETDLIEAYKIILENIYYIYTCPEYGNVTEICRYCEEEKGHNHDKDCIVLKAQRSISEIKVII